LFCNAQRSKNANYINKMNHLQLQSVMKKCLLAICITVSFGTGFAQDKASAFTDRNNDQLRDPRDDQMSFVLNEVLVKFKDEVPLSSASRLRSAGLSAVDKVLQASGVDSLVRLFPNTKNSLLRSTGVARIVKDPQGRDMKIPNLDKIYKITLPQLRSTSSVPVNIFQVIEDLKALPEVEYAEPNYIFTIGDFSPAGPEMTADKLSKQESNKQKVVSDGGLTPNDPLYSQQWGIPATNIDKVWNTTTGDSTAIIGILDTGVDWQHPDLAANIWTNTQEIPGNGKDDDGDGLIDDIRGWDFINNDNNPMDDNSHGTHVAGIAAAVGNNGIGIAGVNWNAKILPIKVFQSSGRGDAATIAKGVNYAASKGAMVINMSFGSYSESLTLKDALTSAYATAVLVAAAGNDGLCIGPGLCPDKQLGAPLYPGAYSFVLGVEAPPTPPIGFTNYDQDGPVFSGYPDLLNYELRAPGTDILSCVPGGNYRKYNGTSMAAPMVAGAISLYRQQRPSESQEMLFGNFINSLGRYIDLEKAINIIPEPKLDIVSYSVTDTIDGDRDSRPDAGETIELKVKVRNTWGQANDVKVGIEFSEFEDQTTATILTSEASIGSVSAYATKENTVSLKLKLAANINDGRDIVFKLKTWYGDHLREISQPITINVENGVEIKGMIIHDMTLYANKYYIVTDNLAILPGVTLTIKPGTVLKFKDDVSISSAGTIKAIGTKDSMIVFTKTDLGNNWRGLISSTSDSLRYCRFEYITKGAGDWTKWIGLTDCEILNCNFSYSSLDKLSKCNILFNRVAFNIGFGHAYSNGIENSDNCNILYNRSSNSLGLFNNGEIANSLGKSNIFNNKGVNYSNTGLPQGETNFSIYNSSTIPQILTPIEPQYHGSSVESIARNGICDFYTPKSGIFGVYDLSNMLLRPSSLAHGLVWKVVVNGKDAQDEYNQLDPLGVGEQKYEVYFNRAMDIKYPPTVSMGVRYPYSQTAIAEDGSWSADSTIYTVYKNVGLTTGDGINTLRVTGAKDMDHFEIPIEDRRFRVVVSAANSASVDFMATAGLGKVNLEWNNSDLADGLGYNMYRMEHINDSTLTKPVLINKILIADTLYTDFDVTPNKKYYYYYKVLRTNLTETDSSKFVSAIPFTASKGDANGDLSVNVLDITAIVAYLLNNNPQPFITEAADLNSDGNVNVLDIVGVVNLVLNGGLRAANAAVDQQARLYLQNDTLFADATTSIGGLQLDLKNVSSINDIQLLTALQGFESGYNQLDSSSIRLLYYSMSGKTVVAGNRIPLLKLKKGVSIIEAVLADKVGARIPLSLTAPTISNSNGQNHTVAELGQNYPNPFTRQTILPIQLFEDVDEAYIQIYNMIGQEVNVLKLENPVVGMNYLPITTLKEKGMFVYKLEVRIGDQRYVCPVKKMIVL